MVSLMATETATIRVTRETRDRLAARARARGISVSALLGELARAAERDATFRAERDAARADEANPRVAFEERDWEQVLDDGDL
jgi:post-segregation antitoxin (ccd killing protein)